MLALQVQTAISRSQVANCGIQYNIITCNYGCNFFFTNFNKEIFMTMHFGQSSALHVCTTYSKLSCNLNVKPLLVREQQTACLTLLLLNPLMGTLKLHSNESLHNNMVIGTAMRGLGRLRPHPVPSSLYQMLQTAHPSLFNMVL